MASILIPTFNRPQYLADAISSALAQTVSDIEVVVGDDGEYGASVVAAASDERVRYQRNPERLGIAGNWSRLLDSARATFVLLLMDDDRLEPGFVERCLGEFDADQQIGVVFTNHTFTRDGGHPPVIRRCDLAPGRHDRFAETFVRTKPVGVSAAMWRRGIWPDVRPLPNTAAADMVLFGRIAELGWPFHFVPEPLMHYRVHETNYSSGREFRGDGVIAWESLTFTDTAAQLARDRRLADALLSRASAALREGELAEARRDLRRAGSLHRSSRWLAFTVAAADKRLATAGNAVARATARRRARRAAAELDAGIAH